MKENTFVDSLREIWEMVLQSNVLQLVWALLVLIAGWLLAVICSRAVGGAIRRLNWDKHLPEETGKAAGTVEKVVTRIVFYLILLLTILGCLTALNLTDAAGPIRDFVAQITSYGANIIGAALLVFIAWVVASMLKYLTSKAMTALKLDDKISAKTADGEKLDRPVTETVGSVVYYVTFLFFVPAILSALNIKGITGPLEQMLAKLLDFVPHLIAAAAVLFFGLLVARLVRKAITGLLFIGQIDTVCSKAGCKQVFGDKGLAYLLGLIAYILVAIPVIIVALSALKIDALTNSLSGFLDMLLNATGNVIGAGIVVFVSFIIGGILAGIVSQLLEGFGFDKLIHSLGFAPKAENAVRPSTVVGKLTLIAILFFGSIAACELLGFQGLKELIHSFLLFGGNILVAIVVLMVGIFLANLAAGLLRGKSEKHDFLATLVRIAVLIFTGAIALHSINVGGRIVELTFGLLLGAVCVAIALAFGIGGREFAARKLEEWSARLKK